MDSQDLQQMIKQMAADQSLERLTTVLSTNLDLAESPDALRLERVTELANMATGKEFSQDDIMNVIRALASEPKKGL